MPSLLDRLDDAEAALAHLPSSVQHVSDVGDSDLLAAQRRLSQLTQRLQTASALAAAEIARRSRSELGYAGLAQQAGARTPEKLVQQLTGVGRREASTLVRIGGVLHDAEAATHSATPSWTASGAPWLAAVAHAVARGELGVAAADAIRTGLGTTSDDVSASMLRDAVERLLPIAPTIDVDELFKRARDLRDDIDYEGAVERQRERYDSRSASIRRTADGMIRLHALLAPEAGGELLVSAFDAVTSPRRGGPRFVDPAEQQRASRLADDPRTNEQLLADALVELVRLGVEADPGSITGAKKPSVRMLVADHVLASGSGLGRIEGSPASVTVDTVEAEICTSGVLPIRFDRDGGVLELGRDQRLFSAKQRIALAARDGGCRFPGCDRPPSWCEAHHITPWQNGGRTDANEGVLLCRHHHLWVHNHRARIVREGPRYLLIPPRSMDPQQNAIELPSKSPALADALRERASRARARIASAHA